MNVQRHPSSKHKSAIGYQTNGKLKANGDKRKKRTRKKPGAVKGVINRQLNRERQEGVVALYLPNGVLKTRSGLKPIPRCEPSTYQPISHCANGVG